MTEREIQFYAERCREIIEQLIEEGETPERIATWALIQYRDVIGNPVLSPGTQNWAIYYLIAESIVLEHRRSR